MFAAPRFLFPFYLGTKIQKKTGTAKSVLLFALRNLLMLNPFCARRIAEMCREASDLLPNGRGNIAKRAWTGRNISDFAQQFH